MHCDVCHEPITELLHGRHRCHRHPYADSDDDTSGVLAAATTLSLFESVLSSDTPSFDSGSSSSDFNSSSSDFSGFDGGSSGGGGAGGDW